jgi:hypothetical protein
MKFSEIANRLTGISAPLGGVSWHSSDLEVSAATPGDCVHGRPPRALCDELEVPSHCVHSVLEIRHFLSGELGKLDTKSEFAASLRAMRAALPLGSWSESGPMAGRWSFAPITTATGRAERSTAPWGRCGVRLGSTWRR